MGSRTLGTEAWLPDRECPLLGSSGSVVPGWHPDNDPVTKKSVAGLRPRAQGDLRLLACSNRTPANTFGIRGSRVGCSAFPAFSPVFHVTWDVPLAVGKLQDRKAAVSIRIDEVPVLQVEVVAA